MRRVRFCTLDVSLWNTCSDANSVCRLVTRNRMRESCRAGSSSCSSVFRISYVLLASSSCSRPLVICRSPSWSFSVNNLRLGGIWDVNASSYLDIIASFVRVRRQTLERMALTVVVDEFATTLLNFFLWKNTQNHTY